MAAVVCLLALLTILVFSGRETIRYTAGEGVISRKAHCVVLDAGHGGDDPGKIGVNDAKEKDVNLQIAEKVRYYLEANDVEVVMTREDDEGLYDRQAANKKVQDMKKRVELIEQAKPEVTVSIHQNSYPEEAIHGAQVFYYKTSKEGQQLASVIQKSLIERNDSYYLLKKTAVPIVIVECGFLSNRKEAEKLCTEEYQEELAWAVAMGILQYLNEL